MWKWKMSYYCAFYSICDFLITRSTTPLRPSCDGRWRFKASDNKIRVVREKSERKEREKRGFVEVSKNLARYRSGNNFIRSSK